MTRPTRHEAQTAPHEQSDDLTTLGAKRRANADLTDPLPHRERDHGVEADGREQERERAGPASGRDGGDHGTPFRRFDGRERSRGHDGQRRCFVGRRGANRRQQLFGRTVRADEQVTGRVHARLVDSHDVTDARERGEAPLPVSRAGRRIVHDADDGERPDAAQIVTHRDEAPADRIGAAPQPACQAAADDDGAVVPSAALARSAASKSRPRTNEMPMSGK